MVYTECSINTASSNRLLGPGHRDVMQLTSNLRDASQVLFTNPDVRLMPPDPDEFIELQVGIFSLDLQISIKKGLLDGPVRGWFSRYNSRCLL